MPPFSCLYLAHVAVETTCLLCEKSDISHGRSQLLMTSMLLIALAELDAKQRRLANLIY